MKKLTALALALALTLSLTACGGKKDTADGADAPVDANALLTAVWDTYTDD